MAVARVLGQPGNREWLIYVHATKTPVRKVELTIPDYGNVTADATLGGNYYLAREADKSLTEVASGNERRPISRLP